MPKPPNPTRQRGLALVVVLWAAVLMALIAGGVARLTRADLNLTRNLVEATKAELAADSALRTALYTIINDGQDAWRSDGAVYAWRFGGSEVRVRVTDELGRIDINTAPQELLAALFVAAGTAPEEATELANAVVDFRTPEAEEFRLPIVGPGTELPSDSPGPQFALTAGLEQVPGMPPALQRRIAHAITVYTGQAAPKLSGAPALVLAAVEGRVLDEPEGEAETSATAEAEPLGDTPAVLGELTEPAAGSTRLLHIQAEALSAGGSYFAREAVIMLSRREALGYRYRLWRRGDRVLFPAH